MLNFFANSTFRSPHSHSAHRQLGHTCHSHTPLQGTNFYLGSCCGLNLLGLGSGTVRRFGLVGAGVAWLEEVCHYGGGLWDPSPSCLRTVCTWHPLDKDVELSAAPAPCLPGYCHAPTLMAIDWTCETVSQSQLNAVLHRVALVMVSIDRSKTLIQLVS